MVKTAKNRVIEKIYPLTPMQEGMLFHKMFDEKSTSYVVQEVMSIKKQLDEQQVKKSLELLSIRHRILRTAVVYKKVKKPQQIILSNRKIEMETIDLSDLDPAARKEQEQEITQEDIKRGFDLEKNSLLRLKVIKNGPSDYKIIWTFHHIILDGWCLSIISSDFMKYYLALQEGKRFDVLAEEVRQEANRLPDFEDYIKWLRKQDVNKGFSYWQKLLENYSNVATIPPDGSISQEKVENNQVVVSYSEELSHDIQQLCTQNDITVNTLFEVAWGILLQRYTQSNDVVFGKVVSGRNSDIENIQEMVGLFINTIPVRVTSHADDYFEKIAQTVAKQAIDSTPFDYCPLATIQQMNDLTFDTLMVFENYYVKNKIDDQFIVTEKFREETNYPISLVIQKSDVWVTSIMFDTEKYSSNEIKRILQQFKLLIEDIVRYPAKKIDSLNVVGAAETEELLHGFNPSPSVYPKEKPIHTLWLEQVQRYPEREAVVTANERVSYADLEQRANQLWGELQRTGVKSGSLVGIVTEKSVDMVAGLLAILKHGCGYVPLEADYPAKRLHQMMADCQIETILCGERHWTAFKDINVPQLLSLHGNYQEEGQESKGSAHDAAYVIFTSGSTGQPKGVVVEHHNVVRLVKNQDYVALESARVLQTGALSFDASTFEIWGPLLNGGTVALVETDIVTDPSQLRDALETYSINTMWMTAQLFNNLVDLDVDVFTPLESLLIGGEKLSEAHVERFLAHHSIRLINGYGPTENTTFSLYYPIQPGDTRLPIGRPLQHSSAYILQGEQLAGIGMPGELCVGGDGVARGYLNQPALTAEKFVANPYQPGDRLYRTGDLARWLPDGTIEYLGRIDDQVKIRGYRIEPGEIEQVIKQQAGIQDVAVLVQTAPTGEPFLAAYVVYHDRVERPDLDQLKTQLRTALPDYMIPTTVTEMDQLPVTRNGKLDHQALPVPTFTSSTRYVAPKNEREETLVEIFQTVLGVENISTTDDFFALGGHSLRATRLVNVIEAQMGIRLPLKMIFDAPTVAELSEQIEQLEADQSYEPIPAAPAEEYYKMSSPQKRLYIIQAMEGAATAYNIPGVLEMKGTVDRDKIETVCQQLVDRHEILRTSFHLVEGEPVQKIADTVSVQVEYEENDELTAAAALADFVRPFNVEQAPLFRVKMVQGTKQAYLLFDLHHLIADGESINLLTKEFSKLYRGESLEKQTVHYKDYSEWMQHKDLQAQKAYWVDQFREDIPILDLPTDFPRPAKQSFRGATWPVEMTQEIKQAVQTLTRQTNTTEYMVFLAAFMVLLQKYSGQEDIVVGSPISGRTHRDTEGMLGMFVNTLALRGRPTKTKTFGEFLTEIKQTTLNAYEHQEYPFEDLVDEVEPIRDLSRNPLFDCMLVLQNQGQEQLTVKQLAHQDVIQESQIAKFDLTFTIDMTENGYLLNIEYCTDLYKEETIVRLANQYIQMLTALPSDLHKTLNALDCLPEQEKRQVLYEFNDNQVIFQEEKSIKDLVEEQVEKRANEVILEQGDQQLTYAELNKKANQIANHLRALGIGKNDLVAFSLSRSLDLIATILGILKSGAGFLPLEHQYPQDRLEFIIKDSQAKALITEEDAPQIDTGECLALALPSLLQGSTIDDPGISIDIDQLCYCIYTSGSTGMPKGVKISHRNLVNYLQYCEQEYVTGQAIMPLFTNIGFDLTMTSIFIPLCFGGKLVIYTEGIEKDIYSVFQNRELTMIKLTPSHLAIVCEPNKRQVLPQLQSLIVGGEELSAKIAQAALTQFGEHIHIHNEYGPTETTIGCCDYIYKPTDSYVNVLIGQGIANMEIYLLEGEQLCGIGMPGEICVSGLGVSEGYLNRPELTAEKFISHPLLKDKKIYRTGDLGRWLPDGTLQFLGRMDDQVKIRGRRIELQEISHLLLAQPGVQEAEVVVKENQLGDQQLCAYLIMSDTELNEHRIKEALSQQLPDYMIPTYISKVDKFELTSNGKLDKQKLPEPNVIEKTPYKPANTEIEKTVVTILEEVLGVEGIGIHESFFELGGNSLKAIKFVSKLREHGFEVSVIQLFNLKTVERIAALITESQEQDQKVDQLQTLGLNSDEIKLVDTSHGTVVLVEDAILESRKAEIAQFFGKANSIAAHYLFPLSFDPGEGMRQGQSYVDAILQQHYRQIPERELLEKAQTKLAGYTEYFQAKPFPTRKPLSAIQKLSYTMGIRSSFAEIHFQEKIHVPKLEKAVVALLKRHPILRTQINIKKEELIEVDCPAQLNIPFLDLTYVTTTIKERIVQQVISMYTDFDQDDYFAGDQLMAKFILIKKDERDYRLILLCSHLVFDGFSQDILKHELVSLYKEEAIQAPKTHYDYGNYIEQIQKGPQATTQEEIYQKLELADFKQAVKQYQKLVKQVDFEQVRYTFRLNEEERAPWEQHPIELSERLYVKVLQYFFPDLKIPMLVVHNGRKYLDQEYYNYIGEFIDFIPHVVDVNQDQSIMGQVTDKLQFMREHNINMATLFSELKLQWRYPKILGAFTKLNPRNITIPIHNQLMLFEQVQDYEDIDIDLLNTSQEEFKDQNFISILCYQDKIQISTFCIAGQTEGLKRYLEKEISVM
ncbi:hypothetical protein J14TS2_22340 [Bacillus sp. J14TS2]|uniref:non-ribosomal peptide synthetase n=1 Tax=Bacillus sp. J14TS2 TaxID=2807188 RepID=UPI001B2063D2|nr:non-ribosomal peptide synthetase [Bacillus sp. J14TS2]GIN71759.1 hypothetical protein J14TS2_22340 [Bacillus sp. J14TS2]